MMDQLALVYVRLIGGIATRQECRSDNYLGLELNEMADQGPPTGVADGG
jgi:hypothetical protein